MLPSGKGSAQLRATGKRIARMLNEVGIRTQIKEVPGESYFKDHIAAGDYDLALFSWPATAFPATEARPIFAKPRAASDGSLVVEQNYARVGTDRIDQLFEQAAGELDDGRRKELMEKADRRIWAVAGSLPLYQRPQLVAVKRDLANVGASGFASPAYQDMGRRKRAERRAPQARYHGPRPALRGRGRTMVDEAAASRARRQGPRPAAQGRAPLAGRPGKRGPIRQPGRHPPVPTRHDIRNVAIVAHVDHGKTTLVDAMLKQAGAFAAHQLESVDDRVMDSNDLEREKGITILAKNTAVRYHPKDGGDPVTINIIDTPGHADFGGEVERGLSMVDAVVLLVDASEGPLPQTRFVLRKALQARLPVILCVNKTDRPDARISEIVDETYDLFLDLDADEEQIEFPIVYACARDGVASLTQPADGAVPEDSSNLEPFFTTLLETVPAPVYEEGAPLQAHVTNLDADNFLGRIALLRVKEGSLKKGQTVAWMKRDGTVHNVRITELLMTEALTRKPASEAGPGDICAVAGIPDIMIGETLADAESPVALPLITVDEPAISMTIGTNNSPLVGKGGKGHKVTARLVKDRLDRELIGNVSLRVLPTERPDTWEVQGRGELALAILVETMRREGFELTVGKPEVVTREIEGKLHEPVERMTIDAPEEHLGAITQLMASRKGRMETMTNHGSGWVRMEWLVPSRGLIGFRTEFLTETRGTGIAHSIFEGHEPWFGELRTRRSGSLVADRSGTATPFAMMNLQERGTIFIEPGTEVYEGMLVGENSRADDMDVNITKEKKLTNMRAASADTTENLVPPRRLSLEQALEFCREDECIEVTPETVRIRKVNLDMKERARAAARAKR